MRNEEILTIEALRECLFKGRRSAIQLDGIRLYFKRNYKHYTLEQTFEVNAMILGAFELYHNPKSTLTGNK